MDQALDVLRQRLVHQLPVRCPDRREAAALEQQLSLHRIVAAQRLQHLLRHRRARRDHEALPLDRVDAACGVVDLGAKGVGAAAVQREARPGGDVHLLVLRVHRILRQRLQVLPAAQRADAPERGVVDGQVAAVALAEHGALDVRRLELAPVRNRCAIGVDDPLPHVEAAAALLAVAHHDHDPVVPRRACEPVGLGRAVDQRIVVIALHELHPPGRRVEPDEPRVARQPGLGKCDQLGAPGGRLFDQADRLVDRRAEVEEDRRRLDGCDTIFRVLGGHGKSPRRGRVARPRSCRRTRPGAGQSPAPGHARRPAPARLAWASRGS